MMFWLCGGFHETVMVSVIGRAATRMPLSFSDDFPSVIEPNVHYHVRTNLPLEPKLNLTSKTYMSRKFQD
jgi:hypothetical protein